MLAISETEVPKLRDNVLALANLQFCKSNPKLPVQVQLTLTVFELFQTSRVVLCL